MSPRRTLVSLTVLALLAQAATAGASFVGDAPPAAGSVSSATLAAPGGLSASNVNCQVLSSTRVRLTWTATASTFADGYEVFRSTTNGGPYASLGTVAGRSTSTFTDTTVAFSRTYYYVLQATKYAWRSANSAQATVTTPNSACV